MSRSSGAKSLRFLYVPCRATQDRFEIIRQPRLLDLSATLLHFTDTRTVAVLPCVSCVHLLRGRFRWMNDPGASSSPRDLWSERVLGGPPRASSPPGCRRGVARAVALFEFSDGAVMRSIACKSHSRCHEAKVTMATCTVQKLCVLSYAKALGPRHHNSRMFQVL